MDSKELIQPGIEQKMTPAILGHGARMAPRARGVFPSRRDKTAAERPGSERTAGARMGGCWAGCGCHGPSSRSVSASGNFRPACSGICARAAGQPNRDGSRLYPEELLLRLDQPTPGLAHLFAMPMGGQVFLSLRIYLYGDRAAAAAAGDEPRWQAWISERFPPSGDLTAN